MLALFLLVLLTADALVIEFDIHSLLRQSQPATMHTLMHSFDITKGNLAIVEGMLSSSPELEHYYCNQEETPDRLYDLHLYAHLLLLHEKVYGLCKLAVEVSLAETILLDQHNYQANLHKPFQNLSHYLRLFTDDEIQSALLGIMRDQIMKMQDPTNLTELLKQYIQTADPMTSFTEFLPVMTPELLAVFLDPNNSQFGALSALTKQYMTEFDNGPEHIIRNLLVVQACEGISSGSKTPPSSEILELSDSALGTLIEHSNADATKGMLGCLCVLLGELLEITDRADIGYWSTLVSFALYVDMDGRFSEDSPAFETILTAFETILSKGHDYLPSFYTQLIVTRCVDTRIRDFSPLIHNLSPAHLPLFMRSIEDKRSLWTGMRVMQVFSLPGDIAMAEGGWDSYIVNGLSKGPLPTNLTCIVGGKNVGNFGDWIISRAEDIVMDGSYTHKDISQLNMTIIAMSWAYLIWEGKQLDFGPLLEGVSSWRAFMNMIVNWTGGGNADVASSIIQRLYVMGLVQKFTFTDIKSLVNLGSNDEPEANSNVG